MFFPEIRDLQVKDPYYDRCVFQARYLNIIYFCIHTKGRTQLSPRDNIVSIPNILFHFFFQFRIFIFSLCYL